MNAPLCRPVEVLCEQVADIPEPRVAGARQALASCCGQPVWVSPSSAALRGRVSVKCLACAGLPPVLATADLIGLAARGHQPRYAPDAAADLTSTLGETSMMIALGRLGRIGYTATT